MTIGRFLIDCDDGKRKNICHHKDGFVPGDPVKGRGKLKDKTVIRRHNYWTPFYLQIIIAHLQVVTFSFLEVVEEELEWISNKDAFPAVESFVGILSNHPSATVPKHHSPVSVLDGGSGGSTISSNSNCNSNSNSNSSNSSSITTLTSCFSSLEAPRRARSKRRCKHRRGDITGRQLCWSQANNNKSSGNGYGKVEKTTARTMMTAIIGRKCQHCGAEKTPQWRAGPCGPKTLCNACGVRYKSGRLVPEYRPASSPTFSSQLHSNSHRRILEMRRSKQMMGMVVKRPLEAG